MKWYEGVAMMLIVGFMVAAAFLSEISTWFILLFALIPTVVLWLSAMVAKDIHKDVQKLFEGLEEVE